jgi:hypothetical protein
MLSYAYIVFVNFACPFGRVFCFRNCRTDFGDVIFWNTGSAAAHLVGLRDNSEGGVDLCFVSVVCCQGEGSVTG